MILSMFNWAGDLYSRWFSEWLHIHFMIRTVLIIFVLLAVIFAAGQVFRYILAPLLMYVFVHVIFRAWNFLFVETPQEWLYIRYHSQDNPKFGRLYLKLTDSVKHNRMVLSHTKYRGMIMRTRTMTNRLIVICAVIGVLWVSAFALHVEYAAPVVAVTDGFAEASPPFNIENNEDTAPVLGAENENGTDNDDDIPISEYSPTDPPENIYEPVNFLTPVDFAAARRVILNDAGSEGARLRDGPGITGRTVIQILWDDAALTYLNAYAPDPYVSGLYWLRVQTEEGTVGYISSLLLDIGA